MVEPRKIEIRETEIVLPDDQVLVKMEGTGLRMIYS